VLTTLSEIAESARRAEGKLNGRHVAAPMFFWTSTDKAHNGAPFSDDFLPEEKSATDATVRQDLESNEDRGTKGRKQENTPLENCLKDGTPKN